MRTNPLYGAIDSVWGLGKPEQTNIMTVVKRGKPLQSESHHPAPPAPSSSTAWSILILFRITVKNVGYNNDITMKNKLFFCRCAVLMLFRFPSEFILKREREGSDFLIIE